MFRFEKLDVWQRSLDLADVVYEATKPFPPDERFGLTMQVRRAAVSVSSNTAEGAGRSSNADFSRFLEISYGSLMEVVSQAHLPRRPQMLTDDRFAELIPRAEQIARMLSGLRSSLTA